MRSEYDLLLAKSIRLSKAFEAFDNHSDEDQSEEDEDSHSEEREQAGDALAGWLSDRIGLLKKLEHLRTIEDAFPRVKVEDEEQLERIDATDLLQKFMNGEIGAEEMKAAGRKLVGPERKELSDEELRQFRSACAELAQQNGYEFESDGAYVTLKKGDMKFSLKHFAFPSGFGLLSSRISVISSWREGKEGKKESHEGSGIFVDDGQWVNACTDLEMQKEIDRIVAVFG